MNIVGLMLVRDEDWVLRLSLGVALRWCDRVLVHMDRCTDGTGGIVEHFARTNPGRVHWTISPTAGHWDEMHQRQRMLLHARETLGATHIAIVDADEALTANLVPSVRGWFQQLGEGDLLDLPMLATRTLDSFQDDHTDWSRAVITLGFRDGPDLSWRPAVDGYQHHNRPPYGHRNRVAPQARGKSQGGVFHFQFANKRRLLAKHVLYRMVDHLRWPQREHVDQLNQKYDNALNESVIRCRPIPAELWGDYPKDAVALEGDPWHEREIRYLLERFGRERFRGLDLKGF